MSPYRSITDRSRGRRGPARASGTGKGFPLAALGVGILLGLGIGFLMGYGIRAYTEVKSKPATYVKPTPKPTTNWMALEQENNLRLIQEIRDAGPGGAKDRLLDPAVSMDYLQLMRPEPKATPVFTPTPRNDQRDASGNLKVPERKPVLRREDLSSKEGAAKTIAPYATPTPRVLW